MNDWKERWLKPPEPDFAAAGDLLRVICILMVGWYHIWQQSWLSPALKLGGRWLDFTPYVRTGYMFVDMMLAMSGFLCYLPYANERERPAGEFYLRRALRILPSYWLSLLVMLIFSLTDPAITDHGRTALDLLAHLGFVQNLWAFSYTATRMNVVLWTLAVEVQFYLLLPLIAPLFKKRPLITYAVMTGVGLSFMFLWTAPMADTTLFVNRLPNMLVVYANGMLSAHVYARLCRVEKRRGWIALSGLLLMAISVWTAGMILYRQSFASGYDALRLGQLRWRWLFSLCASAFLLGGSVTFAPIRSALSHPAMRFLSGVSFNFYIWHQWLAVRLKQWRIPAYQAAENPNMAGEMPWQLHYTLICFAAALALAVLVTYLVEKPGAKYGRKLYNKINTLKG